MISDNGYMNRQLTWARVAVGGLLCSLCGLTSSAMAANDTVRSRTGALRILFIGNSFTEHSPGAIPGQVHDMAVDAGFDEPYCEQQAVGGLDLSEHRVRAETLAAVDAGAWDYVVVQGYSTRPTDNAGDPPAFKADVVWFYDRIKTSSPDAQVVLYETWARHPDHDIYPDTFVNAAEMQAQLRFHYNDAADNYVPANATVTPTTDIFVAPVGDAWENHLAEADPLRLHFTDNYHASLNGRYLSALVIYSSIYQVSTQGLAPLTGVDAAAAKRLQDSADATLAAADPDPDDPPEGILVSNWKCMFGNDAMGLAMAGWCIVIFVRKK